LCGNAHRQRHRLDPDFLDAGRHGCGLGDLAARTPARTYAGRPRRGPAWRAAVCRRLRHRVAAGAVVACRGPAVPGDGADLRRLPGVERGVASCFRLAAVHLPVLLPADRGADRLVVAGRTPRPVDPDRRRDHGGRRGRGQYAAAGPAGYAAGRNLQADLILRRRHCMYQLYIANKNYSSWSLRPWLLLSELSVAFDERLVTFAQGDGSSWAGFREFSPNGKVPCLHDGDAVVWDSLAIA